MKNIENIDVIEESHNSIIISLATCGGIVHDFDANHVLLTVTFPNPNKHELNKEIFKTFKITKEKYEDIKEESYELHIQISGMIEEEEVKKMEEDKRIEEENRKNEEEKKLKSKEIRKKKTVEKENPPNKEKDDKK